MKEAMIFFAIAALAVIIGIISIYFFGKDNPVEEACEDIIKKETGADIDLSPDSPESGKENKAS